jgi:putative nucleotidyltransferase with HDIG domain
MAILTLNLNETSTEEADLMKKQEYLLMSNVISSMELLIAAINPYIAGHQKRVSGLAVAIAVELNLPEDTIEGIRISGIFHDIGKIIIPTEILNKPGRLLETEYNLIKTHSKSGYNILKPIDFPWPVADIVLQHHEKYDGSGYPQGIDGDKILIEARILCVANVIESMASHTPYRRGLGIDTALVHISQNSKILYDPAVVNACLNMFKLKKYTLKNF